MAPAPIVEPSMGLRTRLIVGAVILALVCLAGGAFIVRNLNSLRQNQDIFSFKDSILHEQHRALELIQASQAKLYQHKAGYSREIDDMVNNITDFEDILDNIPREYHRALHPPLCNNCHQDSQALVFELDDTINVVRRQLAQYKSHISVLITTSDRKAQIIHHGQANAIGESIVDTISLINRSAGRMVDELLARNVSIVAQSGVAIKAAMTMLIIISLTILAYVIYAIHRLLASLLHGTESISQDDYTLRLPLHNRNDEFGLLASRFNIMAAHLQERDEEISAKRKELEEANYRLRDLNENLELKISERTAELERMISQLQETTRALEESKGRLESTNIDLVKANQAKSNFLSIVSHELKTPLSVINGFLSLILDERYQNDPKHLREAVEISKKRGQQLARMIDELIDLSRLDARAMILHKELVPVGEAVHCAAEQFQEEIQRKQIRIVIGNFGELPPANCDSDKFKQVLTNLLSNAIKFSPEGSEIRLDCTLREESFLFSCRDEGIGIASDKREKVFEKFYQVDSSATRRYGGAGLGLSIVREIVHLHGGKIWVESDSGKGCTFYFTIPRSPAPG